MTSAVVPASGLVGPTGAAARPHTSRSTVRVLQLTLVLVLLLQRFTLPIGAEGISLILGISLAVLAVLVASGRLVHDVNRTVLFGVSLAACGLATWFAGLGNPGLSLNSFLLLCVVYAPWVFRVPDDAGADRGAVAIARTYVTAMLVAAVVAIGQLASQLVGAWTYQDYILELVPLNLQFQFYNSSIPLEYGSPIYKSQAFVFLEPSFLSQFLALAVIVGLVHRMAWWKLVVLGLGMFCTYSGTGMVLLVVGVLVILVRMPQRLRPGFVVVGLVAVAVLLSSPLAEPLLKRTSETTDSSSSLSLRFVEPYVQVVGGLAQDPSRYLVGAGPGSAERLLENDRQGAGLAVVYTIVPKVYFEYGLLAGSLFLVFLGVCLFARARTPVLPAALLVMLGLLSGSLLQPHTLMVAWLLSVVWARSDRRGWARPHPRPLSEPPSEPAR